MNISPLPKIDIAPDLVDVVYQRLRDAICLGQWASGQRLTQEELAEQLAVSRQPVLQAVRLLKRDGLLEDAPGRGVWVAPLKPEGIEYLYQVRAALDGLAVRLAAQRRFQLPQALLDAGRAAVHSGDLAPMIDADWAFHTALYRGSGNPLIEQSATLHWHHLKRAMGVVLQVARPRQSVWDEHQAIAEAVRAGQAERAVALIESHAVDASLALVAHLRAVIQPAA